MQMIRTQERRGVGRGGEGEGEVGESPLGSCEGAEIMNAWGKILENTQKDRNKAVRV